MTYQNPEAAGYINQNFIPWRVDYLNDKSQVERFHVEWTPCLLVLDSGQFEHSRSLGFLSPPELLAFLEFSKGLAAYRDANLKQAAEIFDQVVNDFPSSHVTPEAIWFRGISRFQIEGDPAVLKAARLELDQNHSHSIWAEKASAWGG